MFVNMPFHKENHIPIKNLHRLKGYTAQKLLKDFPRNSWNKHSLQRLHKTSRLMVSRQASRERQNSEVTVTVKLRMRSEARIVRAQCAKDYLDRFRLL